MKQSQQIATTAAADLVPIGGRKERDYERIVDLLARELGPDHASLFSEPQSNADGTRILWYVANRAPVKPLDALDKAEMAAVLQHYRRLETEIKALAERLVEAGDTSDKAFGRALHNALVIPDRSHFYVQNGRPVLVAWGYRRADQTRRNTEHGIKVATQMAASVPAPPPITSAPEPNKEQVAQNKETPNSPPPPQMPTEEAPRRHSWARCLTALLWFIFAGLIAGILYLLFMACAVSFLPWFSYCAKDNKPIANLSNLQREIVVLENAVRLKQAQCPKIPGAGAPLTNAEISDRLIQRSAGHGALQVSLAWNGVADLDLAVGCGGETVWFRNSKACGAELDTDSNGGKHHSPRPVENITWETSAAIPAGKLPIYVTLYSHKGQTPTDVPYTVRVVRRQGDEVISQYSIDGIAARNSVKQRKRVGSANQ